MTGGGVPGPWVGSVKVVGTSPLLGEVTGGVVPDGVLTTEGACGAAVLAGPALDGPVVVPARLLEPAGSTPATGLVTGPASATEELPPPVPEGFVEVGRN